MRRQCQSQSVNNLSIVTKMITPLNQTAQKLCSNRAKVRGRLFLQEFSKVNDTYNLLSLIN